MEHEALSSHPPHTELHALLDGELDTEARRRVEEHLATCPACARQLARTRELFAQIESLPELSLGRDLSRPVLQSLRGSSRPMPVLGVLGLQALAALALIWAASERLSRLLAPLAQMDLPGPVIAGWTSLVGLLPAVRLPVPGFHFDATLWLPRLGAELPDLSAAPDWIVWGFLALGAWLLINSLVLRAERDRQPNGR